MSDLLIWNELGNIYFKLGCHDEAIAAYEKAIELAPGSGWPYSNLGLAYAHQGKFAQAVPLYRKSIELLRSPKDQAISWNRLGDAYRRMNEANQAMAAYQKAVELDVGRLEEAAVDRAKADSVPSEPPAPDKLEDLKASEAIGSPSAAGQAAHPAGEMTDWLGELEQQLASPVDESAEMDKDFQEWLQTSSADSPAPAAAAPASHYWVLDTNVPIAPQPPSSALVKWAPAGGGEGAIASARMQAKENDSATDVLQLEPPARFNLLVKGIPLEQAAEKGKVSQEGQEGKTRSVQEAVREEVRSGLGRLDEYTPSEAAEEERATAMEAAEQVGSEQAAPAAAPEKARRHSSDLEQAVAAYQTITENSPANDRAWDALGNSLRAVGRYPEAVSAFEQAIFLAPHKEEYHYHLGLVYAAQKRHDEAIQAFEQVIQLSPEDVLAHGALAGSYRRLGLEAEAAKHIQVAQPLMEAEREYNRACFEAICGNVDRAIELLKVALETKQTPLEWVIADPDLEAIHADPRFQALVGQPSLEGSS